MKKSSRIAMYIFVIALMGAGISGVVWGLSGSPRVESVESRGVLNIDNRTEVEPGMWSIELPFKLRNLAMDSNVYRVWLEPGETGEVMVKIKEQGQGQVQVELATKIELR